MKRILTFAGILLLLIASFNLVSKQSEEAMAESNKAEQQKENLTLSLLKEKLNEKYVGVDVKTTPDKELVIQVIGDEAYYKTVMRDLESITKSVIRNSPLNGHKVVFNRWNLTYVADQDKKIDKGLIPLIAAISEGLQGYDVIGNINAEHKKSITISTSIKGSSNDARKLATEITEKVYEILHSKKLQHLYEINVLNNKGKVINRE